MKKTKRLFILIITGIMVIASLTLTGCGSKSINLNDYFVMSVKGYDNYGYIDSSFDYDQLMDDLLKIYKDKPEEAYAVWYEIGNVIAGKWDKSTELSNGDKVKFTWSASDEDFSKIRIPVKHKDIELTIAGLDVVPYFDPFEDITITLSGAAPSGFVKVTSGKYSAFNYKVKNNGTFSVGDIATISIGNFSQDEIVKLYGGLPSRTEMEYTVEALDEYITKISDLPKDVENQMLNQLDDFIVSLYADSETTEILKYDVVGYYLLSNKAAPGSYGYKYNHFYIVYKATVHYHDKKVDETMDVYKYIKFHDVMKCADGTGYVDILDYSYPVKGGWMYFGDENFYFTSANNIKYVGFKDLDIFVNQCITSQRADWNTDTNVD